MRRLVSLVFLVGCASMAPIPGGPEDHVPPRIVSVTPDTNSVNFHGNAVAFLFDGVVNDRSGPTQDLNGLFLISPRDGAPRISWHRERIDVRPHGKWRPNTAYSVTLLPGLSDLSANITKYSYTVVFSTGPTLPNLGVVGRVFDWSAQRAAPNAIVEAIQRPDSVVYVAVADSTGQFHVGPFEAGTYTVIAFVDANKNMVRDPGEIWDSTQVKITNTQPMLEMLAAKRDTIGPAIAGIAEDDSVTLRITFNKPLNPDVRLDTAQFRIMSSDSAHLTSLSVRTLAQYDTDRARARADSTHVADSLAAVRDTTKRAKPATPKPALVARPTAPEPPKPSKPAPATVVMIKLALGSHLPPLKQFRVTAADMVNLLGYKGTSSRVFA
ncbi:MAG TPA: Ig-like domain-containing protein, partial [Gemmatimonadaceae bacterium]